MHDISTRAVVVVLKSPLVGKTTAEVQQAITGLSKSTVNSIYARAIERGFEPSLKPLILKDEYLEDAPRSGRPTKHTEAIEYSE